MMLHTKYQGSRPMVSDNIFIYSLHKNSENDQEIPWGGGGGGLNAFYWYQIFALESAVVEVQEMFSSHGSLLIIAMYHHGETLLSN